MYNFQRDVQLNEQRRRSTRYALLSNSDHVEDAEAIETFAPDESTKEVDDAILDTPSKLSVSSATVECPQITTTQSEKETSETSTDNSHKESPQEKHEDDGASHSITGHQQLTDVTPEIAPTENDAISVEKGLQEESSMEVSSILSKLVDEVVSHKITGHLDESHADVIPEKAPTENGANSVKESSMEEGLQEESSIEISRILSKLVDEVISHKITGHLDEPNADVIPETAPTENGANSAMQSSMEEGLREESSIEISRILSNLVDEVISHKITGHLDEPNADVRPETAPTENGANSVKERSMEEGLLEESSIEISRILSKLVDEVTSHYTTGHLDDPLANLKPENAGSENGTACNEKNAIEKISFEELPVEIYNIHTKLDDEDSISLHTIEHLDQPFSYVHQPTVQLTADDHNVNGDQRKNIISISLETLDTDAASTDGHQTYRTRKPGLFRRFYKMISRLSCLPRRKSKKNLE